MSVRRIPLPSPRVALALVVFGVAGVVAMRYAMPWEGDVVAVVALPDRGAVIARRSSNSEHYGFIERRGANGKRKWRRRLPAVPVGDATPWMVAVDDLVAVRAMRRDGLPEVQGVDLDSGRIRWRSAPIEDERDPLDRHFRLRDLALVGAGDAVIHAHGVPGRWTRLVATAAADGEPRWAIELGAGPLGPLEVRPGLGVLVHAPWGTWRVDPKTGAARRLEVEGAVCGAGGRLWHATADGALVGVHGATGASRRVVEAGAWRLPAPLCGTRGDQVVLVASPEPGRTTVLWLDRDTLALEAELDLGDMEPARKAGAALRKRYPAATPLSGELERYVPLQLDARRGERTVSAVVVLDLDEASEHWRTAARPELERLRLVRHGADTLIYDAEQAVLGVLDGRSGRLTAAVGLEKRNAGKLGLLPRHVAGDRLWLHDGDDWAALNARTLDPELAGDELPWLADRFEVLKGRLGVTARR